MDNKIKYNVGKIVTTNDGMLKKRYIIKEVVEVVTLWYDSSRKPLYLLENMNEPEKLYCLEEGIFPYIYNTGEAFNALNDGKRITLYVSGGDIDDYTFYMNGYQEKILTAKGVEAVFNYHTLNATNHWYIHEDTSHQENLKRKEI